MTPILTLSDGADLQVLTIALGEDDMVETANIGISDSAKLAVLEDLLASASGGRLSADESDDGRVLHAARRAPLARKQRRRAASFRPPRLPRAARAVTKTVLAPFKGVGRHIFLCF